MSYTINLTNGTIFATIPDGTINTTSSMVLVGKNYAGYGEFLDENFIHLLENSSNSTAPTAPLTGQLWWDTSSSLLKVYNGSMFKVISAATASATAPASNVAGDLWYDSTNSLLKVYTGAGWLTVGPSSVNGTGATPVVVSDTNQVSHNIIQLSVGNTIVGIVSSDSAFTPSPSISGFGTIRPGFQLSTGGAYFFQGTATEAQTLSGSNPGQQLTSSQFMRSDTSTGTSGSIAVTGNVSVGSGLINAAGNAIGNIGGPGAYFGTVHAATYRGDGSQLTGIVTPGAPTTTVSATGNITGGNILTTGVVSATGTVIGGNVLSGGTVSATGNISGNYILGNGSQLTGLPATYGNANVAAYLPTYSGALSGNSASVTGNISGNYILGNGSQLTGLGAAVSVTKITNGTSQANIGTPNGNIAFVVNGGSVISITPDGIISNQANGAADIGSSTAYFGTVYATATSAQYADVAERFAADADYEPGTVVELGGAAEITKVGADLSDNVFGVISTNAAYLMNSGAGTNHTHPPVAMTGRVPVKVVGQVNKGDRLVSAGNGVARAAKIGEATAFNTIGRALANKLDSALGTVEAIVTIK
jgi:hypothetical protein